MCVLVTAARGSKNRQSHLLLGGGCHTVSLQEETKNVILFTTAGGTVLAEGQIPACGPDHSEVKAGPRTSWFYKKTCAGAVHFLCYSLPPQEEASHMHVYTALNPRPPRVHATRTQGHVVYSSCVIHGQTTQCRLA